MKTPILVGMAVVLLAVAVYISIASLRGNEPVYDDIRVQCTACDHQWDVSARAAAEERAAAGDPRKPLACPRCHKAAGRAMTPCDKCGAWYLPKQDAQAGMYKCPQCGFDPESTTDSGDIIY
ncbi:MAG TPA: hypothetical protein PL151_20790 [Phycisphaerae bacterium]|nr:hypothetical protein [Phycisphaerae bacterium]HOJ73439.1 hypothetical protein [Phycisphaerae bacterium]HOM51048.1 hypothetical protein [Phycisphaerae bacterium]HON67188.1 hypothetical protein [Phycisphaerae bacterium]HOQ85177.1 hypothetical protein [Phycisphaerae bacterium]